MGLIATVVIILSIPLYLSIESRRALIKGDGQLQVSATFAGSHQCRDCHKPEFDKWQQSHHRMAMAEASKDTVLGDFEGATFEHFGVTSRFFKKEGAYFVNTLGPKGSLQDFQITHTFGWYPLQQYLVPFSNGRLQCLPIAWDVERKNWYHLYPEAPPDPQDWLFWTNQGQNWNGMCAECHSTDLKKNYDMSRDTYETTWSEISVGCEACHGPGSEHIKWAELPEMGRPDIPNHGLTVSTSDMNSEEQIQLCAPCHSRRMSLDDNIHRHADFLDYGIPQLLSPGMYYADGQILDEVYVYGSFMQSKMYARDVRCSDCHDVHSGFRLKPGNELCLQCHKSAIYDSKDHHFHKQANESGDPIRAKDGQVLSEVGTGASCEQCHMPGRNYMGIDYRPDHSFRIPRPDLTQKIGVPNACNRCHVDKSIQWSLEKVTAWYGQKQRPHYGLTLNEGRIQKPEVLGNLIKKSADRLYPTIVRATALSLLARYPSDESRMAINRALSDEASLMRYTAVQNITENDVAERLKLLTPLLYDPVRAVRGEAARQLANISTDKIPNEARQQFKMALSEYQQAMARTADFAASRHNLGNLAVVRGNTHAAVKHYQKAVDIDGAFFPAKVNLAMLYNRQGRNQDAEKLFKEVLTSYPEQHEVAYSLGLLLVEMKQLDQAAVYLQRAADGMPQHARVRYNLSILLQQLARDSDAEFMLKEALAIEPTNPEYLYAMGVFYIQRKQFEAARPYVDEMIKNPISRSSGQELLQIINQN